MKLVAISSCLLWIFMLSSIDFQGGEAVIYTNGFPSRLIYRVSYPTAASMRLIPEMNFTCNGVIVGYTVAGLTRTNPPVVIQVWRENSSRPGFYYNTSAGIAIHEDLCVEGLEMCIDRDDEVLCCNLNRITSNVSVQPGDILGLKLPQNSRLAFAVGTKSPTNYVFGATTSFPLALSRTSNKPKILPQITLQIESGIGSNMDCIRGFPDIPVTTMSSHTSVLSTTTLLIPDMNFTGNASIIGFIVTGQNFYRWPYSKIQIWRNDQTQTSTYYRVRSSIDMNLANGGPTCVASRTLPVGASWCILSDSLQITVQPGDILGLELPLTNDVEIFFTWGGPINFILEGQLSSSAVVNFSSSFSDSVQQLPQIIFNMTADHCLSGFPSAVSLFNQGNGRGEWRVTTRLFPDMKFGCFGSIVQVRAAAVDTSGQQAPKIQIWRENDTQPGLYYKTIADLQFKNSNCYRRNTNNRIFWCTLKEDYRISVQPGDFLGLEIPPTFNDDLVVYFKAGGPTNLVFPGTLDSTVNLFTEPHTIAKDEPQITFLVAIDESRNSCPFADISTTTASPTIPTIQVDITDVSVVSTIIKESMSLGSSISGTIAGGIMGTIIAIFLLVAIILLMAVLIQKRHRNQYTTASNGHTNPIANPVYGGASYNRILPTQECQASYKDDTPANYDHIKFNIKKRAVSLHTDDQTFNATYETLEMQHYEMTGPTLATHEEPYIYWEPAKTVNDLHKQMSSNKYRELLRQQVKITKALGSGQFGVVSMGVWQSPTGAMEVAVKQLQPGVTETEKIKFLQEAAINGQFRHPNIVQLMGVVTKREPAMIVLELLSNGDLRNFLIKHQTPPKLDGVDKHLLLQFCQHIASGMSYLASKAFVHRDLAARNILVSKDKICKISDFGMSRDLLDEDYYVSHGGVIPVKWTAPEAIHYKKYSTASDVWSFGCVMYEIWSLGHKPFESYNNPEVIKMIDKGCRLPPPPGLSKELYKIMIQCWQLERSCRPTFPQLVELLSRADFELFLWEEEDLRNTDPRVKEIGAPLEIATGLYSELQKIYLGKH